MNRLKFFIEWQVFGVCTKIGQKLGIASSRIRLWFIYISFLTMGEPVSLESNNATAVDPLPQPDS